MSKLSALELSRLYTSGNSIADIANKLRISTHKVAYWMNKYGIKSRSRSEALYVKNNRNGDPFEIAEIDSKYKTDLLALAIGIFLGEGTKKQTYSVRVANSDPRIILIFMKFLKEICQVDVQKIKAWINLFDDKPYEQSLDYWSNRIKIPKNQFYAPVIRPRKKGSYKNRSEYGTITILVSNTKLLRQVKSWCDTYMKNFSD